MNNDNGNGHSDMAHATNLETVSTSIQAESPTLPQQSRAQQMSLPADISVNNLVHYAITKDLDIEKLDKLIQFQERLEDRQAERDYYNALAKFKENPPQIVKDMLVDHPTKNGRKKYDHASLGAVCEAIIKELAQYGIIHHWDPSNSVKESIVAVKTILVHENGHKEIVTLEAPPDLTGGKNVMQAIGSAITYLERYGLLAIVGLATNAYENDGNPINIKSQNKNHSIATPEQFNALFWKLNEVKKVFPSINQYYGHVPVELREELTEIYEKNEISTIRFNAIMQQLNKLLTMGKQLKTEQEKKSNESVSELTEDHYKVLHTAAKMCWKKLDAGTKQEFETHYKTKDLDPETYNIWVENFDAHLSEKVKSEIGLHLLEIPIDKDFTNQNSQLIDKLKNLFKELHDKLDPENSKEIQLLLKHGADDDSTLEFHVKFLEGIKASMI